MLDTSKIYSSNNYGDFKVLKYVNSHTVHVEFIVSGYKTTSSANSVKAGVVRDKLHPITYGVGFVGDGPYRGAIKRVKTKAYSTWHHMLERCYDPRYHKKYPTYAGVTTCKEWYNFQSFAEWFNINYKDGLHLDKDINQKGVKDKIYSPETCVFVSGAENSGEHASRHYKFKNPEGVNIEVYNLSKFCRDNNLKVHSMRSVNLGRQKQHDGWSRGGKSDAFKLEGLK